MAVDWVEMFREADSLSAAHAIETNCRTLDLFHVACAVILHSDAFASFDQRQRSVAARAGLQVVPETS
jgi:predicted nucleic acid-binding protein